MDRPSQCSAWDYLDPKLFTTASDDHPDHVRNNLAQHLYQQALALGEKFEEIHISISSMWTARSLDSLEASSWIIGRHACTSSLLEGFLASPAAVIVHRHFEGQLPTQTTIKPSGFCIRSESVQSGTTYILSKVSQDGPILKTQSRGRLTKQLVLLGAIEETEPEVRRNQIIYLALSYTQANWNSVLECFSELERTSNELDVESVSEDELMTLISEYEET